jgi:prepilin-type N-terminal cleavage/methylation domain-containing protein
MNSRNSGIRGMTLIEMMVATTASLILLGIVAQLFGILGRGVSNNTNTQALNDRMRSVTHVLRRDLEGITVKTLPPAKSAEDCGYLEIIEGPITDGTVNANSINGDCDDFILFTSRNLAKPFIGKFSGTSHFESQTAEIAWYCRPGSSQPHATATPPSTLYNLYRRQLLAVAFVGAAPFTTGNNSMPWPGSWTAFFNDYDVSCRKEGTVLYPNSLGDLTKRENRFLHDSTFPHAFPPTSASDLVLSGSSREGDDIVLTNVVAFDVRVYDPTAPQRTVGNVAVSPGDLGFASGTLNGAVGAYVDLNWDKSLTSAISGTASFPASGQTAFQGRGVSYRAGMTPASMTNATYDTWSTHYEFNGVNDGDGPGIPAGSIDEGTNGVDDNGDGLVDDIAELETSAPYPTPLRGLEIRIRCYEPSSRQIRQITVRHTFVPH